MSYVTVKDINKQFQQKSVLNNVNFTIEKGERFGLIGPNGAGKSTLIDIMTGLIVADSGEVIIDDINIKKDILAVRKKLGVVPQDLALMEELNGYDNLIYFGGMYGLSGKELQSRVDELLKTIGLTAHAKKKVKTYSGGMKRRLNIAAALLHRPEFLILDEPTVGVDPQSRQYIFDFLKDLNESGTTILYISHYMEEIEALCDRLLILDSGSEVAYGTKAEVKSLVRQSNKVKIELDYVSEEVLAAIQALDNGISEVTRDFNHIHLLVDSSAFSMMRLIQALEVTDSVIKSLSLEDISLEETFLQLTGKSLRE
ncbi:MULTISPECIES: ABC transporter ATP-binding protein [unclassified Facklamia]|uniref:ABC transporter ATP-binding protein n=1 Tax=Aerococcaceae TaxID=186827 RepID=UPI0013B7D9C4|nr:MULTISPECIES: ABC transporter ATP-binding protein [unclassified Facklamia]NEW64450.1 ATP-binding cassette domain-containing protein [Facklamia sp. 252]NEW67657.1 ATP-binding cassette domain-containing protein [Facklamia sp. 253]QQD65637.1 ABC transporter ATP-binding protein [Aerococcaceae bacterium zg-252]